MSDGLYDFNAIAVKGLAGTIDSLGFGEARKLPALLERLSDPGSTAWAVKQGSRNKEREDETVRAEAMETAPLALLADAAVLAPDMLRLEDTFLHLTASGCGSIACI
jgi:hypothetical protein